MLAPFYLEETFCMITSLNISLHRARCALKSNTRSLEDKGEISKLPKNKHQSLTHYSLFLKFSYRILANESPKTHYLQLVLPINSQS